MKRTFAVVFVVSMLLGGCAPSAPFKIGKAFYSEDHAKLQVEQAESENRIEKMGTFATEVSGCGNYSEEAIDTNLMNPAIRKELNQLNGDVATNVKAEEKWYALFLEILVVPKLLGCSDWDVTGDVLRVSAQSEISTASYDDSDDSRTDDHNDFAGSGFAENDGTDDSGLEDDIDSAEIAQPPTPETREATIYPKNRGQQFAPQALTTELTPWMIDKNACVDLAQNQVSEPHVPAFLGCMRSKSWLLKDQFKNFELERKMIQEVNSGS